MNGIAIRRKRHNYFCLCSALFILCFLFFFIVNRLRSKDSLNLRSLTRSQLNRIAEQSHEQKVRIEVKHSSQKKSVSVNRFQKQTQLEMLRNENKNFDPLSNDPAPFQRKKQKQISVKERVTRIQKEKKKSTIERPHVMSLIQEESRASMKEKVKRIQKDKKTTAAEPSHVMPLIEEEPRASMKEKETRIQKVNKTTATERPHVMPLIQEESRDLELKEEHRVAFLKEVAKKKAIKDDTRIDTPSSAEKISFISSSFLIKTDGQPNTSWPFVEVEDMFFREVEHIHVRCPHLRIIGSPVEFSWSVCLQPPYLLREPCLVYSFETSKNWPFEEYIARKFGCMVRLFNPSFHRHVNYNQSQVYLDNIELGPTNRYDVQNARYVYTFQTLLNRLNDSKKIVDILKVVVQRNHWASIEQMLFDGSLRQVKQLLVEFDAHGTNDGPTSTSEFIRYFSVLRKLEKEGFRKYKSVPSRHESFRKVKHSFEFSYINTKFLDP